MKLKNELKINKKNITKKRIIKKKRNVNKKSLKKMRGKNKKTLKRNYVKKGGNNYVNDKIRDILYKRVNYFKLGNDYYERYPIISFDSFEFDAIKKNEKKLQEYIDNLQSMKKELVELKNQDKNYASVDNTLKTKKELEEEIKEITLKMYEIQINLDEQKQKLELEKNEFIKLTIKDYCANVKDSGDNCRKYIKIDKRGNIKFCMSTTMSRNMTKRMYRGKGSCSSSNDIIKNEDIHLIEDKDLSMIESADVVKGKTDSIYNLHDSQDNHKTKTKTNPTQKILDTYLPK